MIVRKLDEVKTVEWGNGLSRRFLLEADGMGYTVTDTIVRAGTKSRLEYKNHLEACYCIEGKGSVIELAPSTRSSRAPSTRSTSTTRTTSAPHPTRTCGWCACSRRR
jgi:Ectoine synthase